MWKLLAFEYLQMDCYGSGHIVGLVNETFSLYIKLHI